MKFSIITITYNAEAFLEKTLESIALQHYRDYEHIIWDGGSSDRTLEIIKKFPDVKLYCGKDEGISDAMNRGAEHAQGDFIWHLHADDVLASPCSLSYVSTAIDHYPQSQWFYGRAHIIDHTDGTRYTTPIEHFSKKRLGRYNFLTHPSTILSKKLFQKVGGFDVNLKYCMDYDLWLRAAQQTSPVMIPTVLACFRQHEASTSSSRPLQVADEAYAVRKRYLRHPLECYRSYRTWKKRREKSLCSG